MVIENNSSGNQVSDVVTRSTGVFLFVKNIIFAVVFLVIIAFMFLVGVPWYYVLIFLVVGGFIIFMSVKKSLAAARGKGSLPKNVLRYQAGETFKQVDRY